MKSLYFLNRTFIFIAIITMALTSCKKDEIASLKMTIEGSVYDRENGNAVEGASIQINTSGSVESATTDENGFFSLGNHPTGVYTITVSKDNYLKITQTVSSSADIAITDNTETVVANTMIALTPMDQSATLTVYKYNDDASSDVKLAAANVPFTVYVDALNQFTGTTDADGLISLDNLPWGSEVYFIFNFEEDGITYSGDEYYYAGSSSKSITVYGSAYTSAGDLGLVSTNITNSYGDGISGVSIDASIILNFTQPINTTDYFYFSLRSSDYTYTDYSITWSNDNKTVTLTPANSLSSDTKYYLDFDVYNESNNDDIYDRIIFYTE